jgi:hypothetical protein
MAGLFGYIAAGAAEGVGTSIVDEARAKREAAIEDLRHQRLMDREGADREFRTSERQAGQAFSAQQNQLSRENSGDLVTLDDGSSAVRSGSTVKPLTDASGKPVKAARKDTSENPAEVKAAEWLIKTGVAKDPADAWNKVKAAKNNDNQRAKLVLDTYKTMKEDYSDTRTEPEKRQAAQDLVDDLIRQDDGAGAKEKPTGTTEEAPSSTPGDRVVSRPKDMSDDAVVKQAQDALAKGADKAKVAARLRQLGLDPAKAGL